MGMFARLIRSIIIIILSIVGLGRVVEVILNTLQPNNPQRRQSSPDRQRASATSTTRNRPSPPPAQPSAPPPGEVPLTPSAPPLSEENPEQNPLRSCGFSRGEAMDKIRMLLECSICLEEFQDPRVLPCHHSFCFRCLEKMQMGRGNTIRCPNCNHEVTLRRNVEELPSDFRANTLRECLNGEARAGTPPPEVTRPANPPVIRTPSTVLGMMICPVCEDLFSEPRRLDCGHSFCVGCIEFMMPMSGSTIHCPCCDSQTVLTHGAYGLPVDTDTTHLIQTFTYTTDLQEATPESVRNRMQRPPMNETQTVPGPGASTTSTTSRTTSMFPDSMEDLQTRLKTLFEAIFSSPTADEDMQKKAILLLVVCAAVASGVFIILSTVHTAYWLKSSALVKIIISVVEPLGRFVLIGGVILALFELHGSIGITGDCRRSSRHDTQKYAGWIGAVIGAEILTYYSAGSDYGLFCAVCGALLGCVLLCLYTSVLSMNQTITSRTFIEGLGIKSIIFIILGALYGTGFVDAILFGPVALCGGFLGMYIASRIVACFTKYKVPLQLVRFNVFLTIRGAVLGNILGAVLSKFLHSQSGSLTCVLKGSMMGVGIAFIVGEIYLPILKKIFKITISQNNRNNAYPTQNINQRRVLLSMGTLLGGLLGLLFTSNVMAGLLGALLGLYFCEQSMTWLTTVSVNALKLHVHCVVGGLLGCSLGILMVLDMNSPICGPLLGVLIEGIILHVYRNDIEITRN